MNQDYPPPAQPRRSWLLPAALLAVIIVFTGAAGAWLVLEQRRSAFQFETLGRDLRNAQERMASLSGQVDALRAESRALFDRAADADRRIADAQSAVERVARSRGNVDYALAEVEYLLILAEQRLALMQDAETARAALEAVERRLEGLHASGLDAVRAQVAVDRLRLAEVRAPDLGHWMGVIDRVAAQSERLPLRSAAAAEQAGTPAGDPGEQSRWRRLLHAVWQELRGMVIVRRGAPGPALFPAERHLLTQGLLLKIESVRLALLRRDASALQATALDAAAWIRRWFDTGDGGVRASIAQLEELAALDVAPALPDITSSMETLRALIRERAAPQSPLPEVPATP
jgi:uroporphyrin-3 C-methyltransferase